MRAARFLMGLSVAFSAAAHAQNWDLNDVSILFPLPQTLAEENLWKPTLRGVGGELLSFENIKALPPLLPATPDEILYRKLRVVGLRIDPCFPTEGVDKGCRAQVRIIWQPLVTENPTLSTADAAFHSFYDLTPVAFARLVAELQTLKQQKGVPTKGLPLGVHPALAQQGIGGAFGSGLQQLLLRYIGAVNLRNVTMMQLSGAGIFWTFSGFDIKRGEAPLRQEIPRVGRGVQTFRNNVFSKEDQFFRDAAFFPEPEGDDLLTFLLRNEEFIDLSKDEPQILLASRAAARIENPRFHSPATMDCASCHVAITARIVTDKQFPALNIDMKNLGVTYASNTMNLRNLSEGPLGTKVLRAFGYFDRSMAIAQRTINESAEVADQLNRQSY